MLAKGQSWFVMPRKSILAAMANDARVTIETSCPPVILTSSARPTSSVSAHPELSSFAPCLIYPSNRCPPIATSCVVLPSPGISAWTISCLFGTCSLFVTVNALPSFATAPIMTATDSFAPYLAVESNGIESVNARWGNLTAILAGDILLGRASEIAASLGPVALVGLGCRVSRADRPRFGWAAPGASSTMARPTGRRSPACG